MNLVKDYKELIYSYLFRENFIVTQTQTLMIIKRKLLYQQNYSQLKKQLMILKDKK